MMSYNRNKKKGFTKPKENQRFTISPEGSLGLLALGDIGLDMWRNVRDTKKGNSHE